MQQGNFNNVFLARQISGK